MCVLLIYTSITDHRPQLKEILYFNFVRVHPHTTKAITISWLEITYKIYQRRHWSHKTQIHMYKLNDWHYLVH